MPSTRHVLHTAAAERKLVSVLFADINGFTSLSEKLDPEKVTDTMNQLFERLGRVVQQQDGTIDKFMGDCIMALFGAPVAHENDPELAVICALKMQEAVSEFNQTAGHNLSLSIGINSGMCIAGGVGSEGKMDYTVMGDTVNVAQRLQSAAGKGQILVSKSVQTFCDSHFDFHATDPVLLKGKERPVDAFVVRGQRSIAVQQKERGHLPPLIGREAEVLLIGRLLDEAKAGRGQILFMMGEAGIGKSRLRLELKRIAESKGLRYFESKCSLLTRNSAYSAVIQLLRSILRIEIHESASEARERLKDLSSYGLDQASEVLVRDLLGLHLDDDEVVRLDAAARKNLLFKALKSLVYKMSTQQPMVIHVEDLHWIDPMSREILGLLIEATPKWSLFLSCGLRPDFHHEWGRKRHYHQMSLGPLTLEQSLQIVSSILGCHQVPKPLQDLIEDKSDGNPLYISEIVKNLLEAGKINRLGEVSDDLRDLEIPATVQGLIASRIDRLGESEKSLLQIASVIGRRFRRDLLGRLIQSHEQLDRDLESLQQKELIYEVISERADILYSFNHALTQDVAYQSILLKTRKAHHLMVGLALEAESEIENIETSTHHLIETLAHHFDEAEDGMKALRYQILSGQRAAANFENAGAMNYFQKAIDRLTPLAVNSQERLKELVDITSQLSQVYAHVGDYAKSEELQNQIISIAEKAGDKSLRARGYRYLADSARKRGHSETSLQYLGESLTSAVEAEDDEAQIRAWKSLGSTYRQLSQLEKAQEILLRGLEGVKSLGNQRLEAEFLNDLATVYLDQAKLEEASQKLQESIEISRCVPSLKPLLASSINNLGCILQGQGNMSGALNKFRAATKTAREIGDIKNSVIAQNNTAEILIEFENFEEALAELSESRQLAMDAGFLYFQISAQIMIGFCQIKTGQVSQGLRLLEEMASEASQKKFLLLETDSLVYQARHHAAMGDPKKSLSILQRGSAMAKEAGSQLVVNRFEGEIKKIEAQSRSGS